VRDRIVQAAVDLVTREIFEREFEECSHAYRCGRSVRTAVHRIAELRRQGYRWVVDADIDAFFETGGRVFFFQRRPSEPGPYPPNNLRKKRVYKKMGPPGCQAPRGILSWTCRLGDGNRASCSLKIEAK